MPFVPEHITAKEEKPPLESFDTTDLLKELDEVYKQIDAHLSTESAAPTVPITGYVFQRCCDEPTLVYWTLTVHHRVLYMF